MKWKQEKNEKEYADYNGPIYVKTQQNTIEKNLTGHEHLYPL
jgi:hypothetical protein